MTITRNDIERLAGIRTVDLTTVGRVSGHARTVEIWWFRFEDRFIITGTPGRRDWLANVRADPTVVIAAGGVCYRGVAVEVTDPRWKRSFFEHRQASWYRTQAELDALVAAAPMIEIASLQPM